MKILFAGLGSIGQRHLQNVKKIKEEKIKEGKIELFGLIKDFDARRVIKEGECKEVESMADYYGITTTTSLAEAKEIKPNIVFVTNPSRLHVETALEFGKVGSDLFIEKPLGAGLDKVDELESVIRKNHLISMVGYQMRFNPLIEKVKEIVGKNSDKIITAAFEWNTFLPLHHKYEDYSKSYAARKDLGGGAVLGLIHEIDLICHFFGLPSDILAAGGKLSGLKMDVEDTVMAILKYEKTPVYLNLSYAQTKEVRKFKVQFQDSTLFVDLMENKYQLYGREGELVEEAEDPTQRNDLFIKEVSHFLDCVEKRRETGVGVPEGKKSLELALNIKKRI